MNPRIASKGKSFKGVMAYLLHDKQEKGKEAGSDRVDWSHTHNLPTDNPKQATAHMIDLAKHGNEIIIANGGKKPRSGSPVLHFSLGWHPDDKVSDEQMVNASIASLKKLGMHKHQAIFVKHLDGDHQHIHVVANRVHPETGKMAKLSNDRVKLSKLAQELNKEHGWKEAEKRVENNEKREKGEFVKHKEESTREQWIEDKARAKAFWGKIQTDQKKFSKQELNQRTALFRAKEEQVKNSRALIKDAYKSKWNDLYKSQRAEMDEFKEKTQTAFGRAKYILRHREKDFERNGLSQYFRMVKSQEAMHTQIDKRQQTDRKDLSSQVRGQTRDQMKLINKSYKQDRLSLDEMQRSQRSSFDKSQHEEIKQFRDVSNTSEWEKADEQEQDQGRVREREFKPKGNEPT